MTELEKLLAWIKTGHVNRTFAEDTFGHEAVKEWIATGKISYNPWNDRLEVARGTEDFYP